MSVQMLAGLPTLRVVNQKALTASSSELEIIAGCQAGDTRAFELLLKSCRGPVYGMLRKLAPDLSNSHDDLAQEIFVRIYRSIHTLRNPLAFKRWLHQLVTNIFYDELRKKSKFSVCSLDEPMKGDEEESASRDIADSRHLPDEVMERAEIIAGVNAAIETLPSQFKQVIVLRELHGLAYEEIAQRTKSDLGTVKSRIARARAKIQPHLKPLRCA